MSFIVQAYLLQDAITVAHLTAINAITTASMRANRADHAVVFSTTIVNAIMAVTVTIIRQLLIGISNFVRFQTIKCNC